MKKKLDFSLYHVAFYLNFFFSNYLESVCLSKSSIILNLKSVDYLKPVLFFLKNSSFTQAKVLTDVTAVDFLSNTNRFELSYFLISVRFNVRFVVRVRASSFQFIPSVIELFSSAGWLEREIWDLFGVYFSGHFDLRRILTDYGFKGHPFRKDFPLNGYYELRYDDIFKTVVSEPVEFIQEFRLFDFRSPWEIGFDLKNSN
jgi:NADH:ubiquinone oxidoreductase subunit C